MLRRFAQLVEPNGHYTKGGLRHYLANRASNGLDDFNAIFFVGRAMWIDPEALERWIRSNPKAK